VAEIVRTRCARRPCEEKPSEEEQVVAELAAQLRKEVGRPEATGVGRDASRMHRRRSRSVERA